MAAHAMAAILSPAFVASATSLLFFDAIGPADGN